MKLASYIDHTALKPNTSQKEIRTLCQEALEHNFASVCTSPTYTQSVAEILAHSDTKCCTVTGFPLGNSLSEIKFNETRLALKNGAQEIDTVINLADISNERWARIESEIVALTQLCHNEGALIKIIIETCLLNRSQIKKACEIAVLAKADFIKTSTGFSTGGADIESVIFIKKCVQSNAKIKASGGIRTYNDAIKMINAGAERLGTSYGTTLLKK